jgi:hypothetical protein
MQVNHGKRQVFVIETHVNERINSACVYRGVRDKWDKRRCSLPFPSLPPPLSLSLSRSHSFSLPFGNKRNAGNRKIRVYRVSRAGNVLLFPAAMRVVQEKRTRVPNKKIAHAKFFKFLINVLTKGGTDFLIGS